MINVFSFFNSFIFGEQPMIKSESLQETRKKFGKAVDSRVRAITAGLGLDELRAVMRGDPPTEKPNPRY